MTVNLYYDILYSLKSPCAIKIIIKEEVIINLNNENLIVKAGELWYANLTNAVGSQQGGIRPVLITTNNLGNMVSPVVEGVAFTTKMKNINRPTHAFFRAGEAGLTEDSILMAEQKWTINKSQLLYKIGAMNHKQLLRAVTAIAYANPIYLIAYENGVQDTPTFKKLAMA